MTFEEEHELPSGRLLDQVIAEKVMGWVELGDNLHYHDQDGQPTHYNIHVARGDCRYWAPSTDLATAWKVVEYLYTKDWWLYLSMDAFGTNVGFVRRSIKPDWKWTIHGLPPPHAICLAALISVEGVNPMETK